MNAREAAFEAITTERIYQDAKWEGVRTLTVGEFALYVNAQAAQLMQAVATARPGDRAHLMATFRRIGAICVAAMERHGSYDRHLPKGMDPRVKPTYEEQNAAHIKKYGRPLSGDGCPTCGAKDGECNTAEGCFSDELPPDAKFPAAKPPPVKPLEGWNPPTAGCDCRMCKEMCTDCNGSGRVQVRYRGSYYKQNCMGCSGEGKKT